METQTPLTIIPTEHPDLRVRSAGFDLGSEYGEQRWGEVLGPSATLLLRRLPTLWKERAPAVMDRDDLSHTLGLGSGASENSRLMRSIERINRVGLACWYERGKTLDVFLQVPGLTGAQLERAPDWTRQAHDRLLNNHVLDLAKATGAQPIRHRLDLTPAEAPTARWRCRRRSQR